MSRKSLWNSLLVNVLNQVVTRLDHQLEMLVPRVFKVEAMVAAKMKNSKGLPRSRVETKRRYHDIGAFGSPQIAPVPKRFLRRAIGKVVESQEKEVQGNSK